MNARELARYTGKHDEPKPCAACNGSGVQVIDADAILSVQRTCTVCDGARHVPSRCQFGHGIAVPLQRTCNEPARWKAPSGRVYCHAHSGTHDAPTDSAAPVERRALAATRAA